MPTVRNRAAVKRYMAEAPEKLAGTVLRGAARAAATVVAEEAKDRSISKEVSAAIQVATKRDKGRIIAKVQVKGPGAYIAPWLEYGTAPHFIRVAADQRQGMSIGRINQQVRAGSLVIGGKFVGDTVFHPGARPHPFLRVSLDLKEAEAIGAAQAFINAHVRPSGIVDAAVPEDDA